MRIAMLTHWNATDGISSHAEPLGKELIKTHELTVFAPTFESLNDDRHLLTIGKDEDFVIRGYEQTWGLPGWIDKRLYQRNYDMLVVEPLDRMPIPNLLEIFPEIKAKKIQVIHEWELPDNPGYYQLDFDAFVCFDQRYKRMLLENGYPEEKIYIIPYPCYPWFRGNKEEARKKLGLPKNALILLSFGRQPLAEYNDYLKLVNELGSDYELVYLIIRADDSNKREEIEKKLKGPFSMLRFERPSIDRLYDYLHASDIHLLPKGITKNIVVSSTVFQCLGSGTPIVIPDTRYVEEMDKEVVKYKSHDLFHLKRQVLRLIKEKNFRKTTIDTARRYVFENSPQKIAAKFIALHRRLCEPIRPKLIKLS